MPSLISDPLTHLAFSVYENKGVFAILLGSGLSRAAEIPTGWEITLDLIRRVALAEGIEEQADWAQWYRNKTGQEPNYSTLLEELAVSPEERRSILHRYIEPTEEDRTEGRKVPTKAHLAIADLVRDGYIRVVVTTNFDRLTENALRERGVEPTIVASPDGLAGAQPLTHSACYLLKLHGDYKDARILNTDAELRTYPPVYDLVLDRILDEYGLIVVGWSGEWDHALRSAFLRAPNRRYPVYWATRGNVGSGAKELIEHRRARTLPITDADTLFTALQQRVATLAHSQQQNPLSIDLLLSSAKRYLARPEFRIQLDELLAQETNRLVAKLDTPDLAPGEGWSTQEFRKRVSIYETAAEPLAKVAGILARWGDGSETGLVLDILRLLYADAEKVRGGLDVWLRIRSYPTVLIFTAYGLGLTRAQRWSAMHQLFETTVLTESNEPARLIETLFLWDWKGYGNDLWKHLEDLDRRKTALSDHLCSLFTAWGPTFADLTPDYELLYERFEMMESLGYLGATPVADLETALSRPGPDSSVRMPVGRIGWHRRNRERLAQELQSEALRGALIQAGFASSARFIELFVGNLARISSRMEW